MTAKNIRRVIAAVSLVVLLGCSMMHLAGCSSILGLPEDGPVQTMTPEEQSTRRCAMKGVEVGRNVEICKGIHAETVSEDLRLR